MNNDVEPPESPASNRNADSHTTNESANELSNGGNAIALAMFDAKLKSMADIQQQKTGRKNMWLAHHWPEHYGERCVTIGSRHVCRRCAALYPLGLLVAILATFDIVPWPGALDPWAIWILSLPATIAYCGEAIGVIAYSAKVQVSTTLIAALAFGRALGYEFEERWSPEFWGPICFFGLVWFMFTATGMALRKKRDQQHSH